MLIVCRIKIRGFSRRSDLLSYYKGFITQEKRMNYIWSALGRIRLRGLFEGRIRIFIDGRIRGFYLDPDPAFFLECRIRVNSTRIRNPDQNTLYK